MKTAAAVAIASLSALGPAPASAEIYRLFQFEVTSWGCPTAAPCGPGRGMRALGGLRIGVSGDVGYLHVNTRQNQATPPVSEYFTRLNVARVDSGSIGIDLRLEGGYCVTGMDQCFFEFEYTLDSLLQTLVGSFFANSGSDMYEMTSSTDGGWTGLFTSDEGPGSVAFAGVWNEIPEPSPVALIGAGLAGLIWVRRRKDTRQPD